MKKSVVAAVLAVSVLFTACSKKGPSTSSGSGTTWSEPQNIESSSETETTTSEEPTETSSGRIMSYDVPLYKKVNYLTSTMEKEEVFAFLSKDIKAIEDENWFSGYNCIEYYYGCYGVPVFEGDACANLNEAIREDFEKLFPNAKEHFEEKKKEISGTFGTEEYPITYEEKMLPVILRADEKITTIYYPYENDAVSAEVTSENLINYETATGKRIAFSDVVKDKDAFVELAKDRISNGITYYEPEANKEADIQAFLTSDNIPFTIDYDGISVYFPAVVYIDYFEGTGHVDYIGNEDVLNGEYFDVLPEDYVLHITPNADFYWDLDGDGKTERIFVDIQMETAFYDTDSFSIWIDDHRTVINAAGIIGDQIAENLTLVHTHGKDFLYIWMGGEDNSSCIVIFEFVGKKAEQRNGTGKWTDMPWKNFDPNHLELLDNLYVVGRAEYRAVYRVSDDGMPETSEEVYTIDSLYGHIFPCLKKDLKVDQVDPDTLEKKGDITLKAGTSLWPVYSDGMTYEIFKVIDQDPKKEVYIRVDLTYGNNVDEAYVNGMDATELFVRVFRGA